VCGDGLETFAESKPFGEASRAPQHTDALVDDVREAELVVESFRHRQRFVRQRLAPLVVVAEGEFDTQVGQQLGGVGRVVRVDGSSAISRSRTRSSSVRPAELKKPRVLASAALTIVA
jgi:hypothetical protein